MKELTTYTYNGEVFTVILTRKKMKNIRYRLRDKTFYISAPYLATRGSIEKGLIKFAPQLIASRKPQPMGEDYIYILGEKYPLSESGIINILSDKIIKFKSQEDLIKKLKKFLLIIVTKRVREYEQRMNLEAHNVRVRNMRSRYGSNSKRSRTVCFALSLVHYSIDIIDAIVVHELSHSIHFDHSPKFYSVVYTYCPDYDYLHKKLRKGIFK